MKSKINKQLTTLIGFNAISSFADGFFYLILLSFVTQEVKLSNLIPFVSMSETLPFFLSVFMGILADRTRRKRKYLLVSSLMRICVYFGIMFFYLKTDIFIFAIAACLLNVISDICGKYGGSLQMPVIKLLISDDEEMEQVQGINSAVGQMASISGTLTGGILFAKVSLSVLLASNIVLFGLVFVMTLGIVNQCRIIYEQIEMEQLEPRSKFLSGLKSTIQLICKSKKLANELILISLMNTLLSLTLTLVSIMASGEKISGQLSIIQTVQIVFMILGSVLAGTTLKKMELPSLFLFFFGLYFMFLVLLLSNKLLLALIPIALFSLILGAITPKFMASIILSIDVKNIGGFMGGINTLIMAAPVVNTALLQILMSILGTVGIVFIYMLISIIAVGLSIRLKK